MSKTSNAFSHRPDGPLKALIRVLHKVAFLKPGFHWNELLLENREKETVPHTSIMNKVCNSTPLSRKLRISMHLDCS